MYYPYLKGKQFELLALRDFSKGNPNCKNIIPIIDPVRKETKNLEMAIDMMFTNGLLFALILNPKEGDYKKLSSDNIVSMSVLGKSDNWIPTLIYRNDASDLVDLIKAYDLKNVMVIIESSNDKDDLINLMNITEITRVVVNDGLQRGIKHSLKNNRDLIVIDEKFNEQKVSTDYRDIGEEFFTDEYLFYSDDGYSGFSDYTTIPKRYSEGGALPKAVAIHLTYEKDDTGIYVKHFVSDRESESRDIQAKFASAAAGIAGFFAAKDRTPAVDELISIYKEQRYPGLGYIKKLSILNHIQLINSVLGR